MKRSYFPRCIAKPNRYLAYSVTSAAGKSVIFRICEGGLVLRKNWGIK